MDIARLDEVVSRQAHNLAKDMVVTVLVVSGLLAGLLGVILS